MLLEQYQLLRYVIRNAATPQKISDGLRLTNPCVELESRMSPEQKALVKETWRKVVPMADAAARLFYDRLFAIDATARPLFKGADLAEQRRKLIQALAMVVQGLDHLEALVPALTDLGRRHAHYASRTAITTVSARPWSGRLSRAWDRTGRRR